MGKQTVSKEAYQNFLNQVRFIDYYYSQYLEAGHKDAYIEKNINKLEHLIDTDQYHKIRDRTKKSLFSSSVKIDDRDYQNFQALSQLTTHLESLIKK